MGVEAPQPRPLRSERDPCLSIRQNPTSLVSPFKRTVVSRVPLTLPGEVESTGEIVIGRVDLPRTGPGAGEGLPLESLPCSPEHGTSSLFTREPFSDNTHKTPNWSLLAPNSRVQAGTPPFPSPLP